MVESLSLRKNFSWMFAGGMLSSACKWLILIVMTKLISTEQVGHYVLALSITAPIVMVSMLQLRMVQATDAQDLHKFEDCFGTRLITNLAALLIVVGILVALKGRYGYEVYIVILIVAVNKAIEASSDITYGLMQ